MSYNWDNFVEITPEELSALAAKNDQDLELAQAELKELERIIGESSNE